MTTPWMVQPNKACDGPSALVALDTETVESEDERAPGRRVLTLSMGVARYVRLEAGRPTRRDACEFRSADAFWAWLASKLDKNRPTWLWAHNLGFDLLVVRFWERVEAGEYRLEDKVGRAVGPRGDQGKARHWSGLLALDDPPTIIEAKHQSGCRLIAVDTMNWFPRALSELGPLVGLPQRPKPGEAADLGDWWERCRRDAEIVEALAVGLGAWVRRHDAGRHRHTLAAQAMALYRHRHLQVPINWGHRPELKALERQAYYGATRQAYYVGAVVGPGQAPFVPEDWRRQGVAVLEGGPVYHLDLSSAYGAAMRGNKYPIKYLRRYQQEPVSAALRACRDACAIAQVELNSQAEPWPCRRGNETWWVTGRGCAWLCGPELERFLAAGLVERVHLLAVHQAGEPFTGYVDELWAARQAHQAAGEELWAGLAKGLIAALHGKFGARAHRWSTVKGAVAPVVWGHYGWEPGGGEPRRLRRCIGRLVQEQQPRGEADKSYPLIAAYVASYVRERMRALKLAAGPWSTLYIDTDSIHVTAEGYRALVAAGEAQPNQLGKLRLVRAAERALYRGPLDYCHDQHVTLVGLARSAKEVGPGLYVQDEFSRLDALLSGQPPEGPVVVQRLVSRPRHPVRGRVGSDGWVEPLDVRDLPV